MKLKMQQGGGLIYTPFIPGAQKASQISSSRSNTNNEESKIDALDKELISLMKNENLLPSDIENISRQIISFQRRASQFVAVGDYSSVMPGMYQIQAQIQKAQFAKKQSDAAEQRMASENAGSEVALDNYGRMYVQDKDGNLSKVSTSDYDSEKYIPVSNSQLLYLRQTATSDNGQIFMDIKNTVGMETVQKEMSEIIKNFGTIKGDKFEKRKMQDIANDLSEGVFKITEKYSKADLNDFSGLLLSQLSKDAQHRITANAKLHGMNEKDYVRTIIASRTSPERSESYEASMSKAVNGENSSGGESGSGDDLKNLKEKTYVEQVITGSNFEWPTITKFSILGNHSDIYTMAQNTGVIQAGENGGKSVGYLPLDNLKNNTEVFVQGANQESVMFGNQIFDSAQQAAIMYDGSAMYRVNLPATEVNGEIVPNWKLIDLVDSISEKIDDSLGKEQIDRILKTYDQSLYWDDSTKTIKSTNNHWFLTFSGIVGSDFVSGLDKNSPFLEELTGPSADMWHRRYDEAMKTNGKAAASQGKFGWMSRTRLYRANIFTPITNPLAGSTEYYPAATRTNNMQTQRYNTERQQINEEFASGQRITNW